MKSEKLYLVVVALFSSICFAEPEVYEKVSGYLFGNTRLSYVTTTWGDSDPKAAISVYFGDGHGKYELVTKAPNANCFGCGGVRGNPEGPVGNIQIKDGILLITFEGGSRDIFTDVFKWRYDAKIKNFLLIGYTHTETDALKALPNERVDANYLTGKKESQIGPKRMTCGFKADKIKLAEFDYEQFKPLEQCPAKKK